MDLNRAKIIDENFVTQCQADKYPILLSQTTPSQSGITKSVFIDLFHSQCVSRHLDLIARELKDQNKSFYTISSSGHEGNVAIAAAFQVKDMAFLHYRSCAFMIHRAKQNHETEYILNHLLAIMAAKDDPIAGGRHKVFGSWHLNVPPQTSTIASHLPKAVGTALAMIWKKGFKFPNELNAVAKDSVVLCSFGDGSANHASAQSAFHAASWIMRQGLQLPLVFICEDNGRAISVPTPEDWIESQFKHKKFIKYISCDGHNIADVYQAARKAEKLARYEHQPVFLHFKTVRLMGHAGSDIEFHYRQEKDIKQDEANDPLLHSAGTIRAHDWMSKTELVELYEDVRSTVKQISQRALTYPRLNTLKEIQSSIIPPKRKRASPSCSHDALRKVLGKQDKWLTEPRNMAQHINMALTELMLKHPTVVLFGEDVAQKGGVYRVTQDLLKRFGHKRIFDTILDEQTILGTAIGFSQMGFIPIPEIQFLAYTVNAFDQIRGEAATLSFFSNGQFTNPMVIRIPSFAYQKGFGGHFHNDNAIAFLREIPGVVIATPSQAQDAGLLLKECVRLADEEQRVVIFLEPIALYMVKDRYKEGDQKALQHYPNAKQALPFHEVGIEGNVNATTLIISFANGMHLARGAAKQLKNKFGIDVLLMDLRWLHPLPTSQMANLIPGKENVLIVDETRKTGSVSEEIVTWIVEHISPLPKISRICGADCFIPLGDAFEKVLPSQQDIIDQVLEMNQEKSHARSLSNG